MKPFLLNLLMALAMSCLCLIDQLQAEQVLIYTYDTNGQLTHVQDSVNGDRDYDYDDAGNRVRLTAGPQEPPPPLLPPPAGLSCWQIAPNVYQASWNAVSGASNYQVRSNATINPERTVTGTSTVFDGASCKWVRACSASGVCGNKAYF